MGTCPMTSELSSRCFAGHTTTTNTRNTTMANYDDCDNNDKDEDKDEDACSLTTYARGTKEFDTCLIILNH
ncbi:hypothetical protein V1478_004826 [Vespula squamosa]|uniref:Uncharacterized protein n=1 Tax=Vespula squamosa TaxID=30214 RepID=A0ABD2BEU2_VESSQ